MALFTWDSNFETGNKRIDEQHRRLVELINELGEAVSQWLEAKTQALIFQQLIDYTRYHFDAEESLMCASGIDDQSFQAHHRKHIEFISFIEGSAADVGNNPQQLLDYLVDWLVNHILQTDQEMVTSLNIGDKQPRGDAESTRAEQVLQVAVKESEGRFRMLADGALRLRLGRLLGKEFERPAQVDRENVIRVFERGEGPAVLGVGTVAPNSCLFLLPCRLLLA